MNHLFFVDDALFYLNATPDSCGMLRRALVDFSLISGELVSPKKSFT